MPTRSKCRTTPPRFGLGAMLLALCVTPALAEQVDEVEPPPSFQRFLSAAYFIPAPTERLQSGFAYVEIVDASGPDSIEFVKQHVLDVDPGVNSRLSGLRADSFLGDWRAGFGDEVLATEPFAPSILGSIRPAWLRGMLADLRTTSYLSGGLRVQNTRSDFSWQGNGGILGTTGADLAIDHFFIGPQLGVGSVAEFDVWRLEAVLLGAVGHQRTDRELNGVFAAGPVPGSLNPSVNARTTSTLLNDGDKEDFAWHGEFRLHAGAQLTPHWRLDAVWRWFVTGPHYDASDSMGYTVPNFSFRPVEGETVDGSDLFLGLTYTH